MNKVVALIVCICLVVSSCNAFADFGFSAMTDEEIASAQDELQKVILERGLVKKITVPSGLYETGVDIPAGKYIITATSISDRNYPQVSVFNSKKDATALLSLGIIEEVLADYGSIMVTLEEGQFLKLESVNYTIEKFSLPLL